MIIKMPEKQWDVFISHASEDKEDIARPLATNLKKMGVKVWYDEDILTIGDSLSRVIDTGLARSTYGIVILSHNFMKKDWPEFELRGLTAKEIGRDKVILPIWHNITRDDLLLYSPVLADKIAISDKNSDLLAMSLKIINIIRPDLLTALNRKVARKLSLRNSKTVVAELSSIKLSAPRHETFPRDLIRRIRLIRVALLDVNPHSMEYWIDSFRADTHPSEEISILEDIAAKYLEIKSNKKVKRRHYDSIYHALLLASMTAYHDAARFLATLPKEICGIVLNTMNSEYPTNDLDDKWPESIAQNDPEREKTLDKELFFGDEANISQDLIDKVTEYNSKIYS